MKIIDLNIKEYFTTDFYNPSPHRFDSKESKVGDRKIPMIYSCENCNYNISFKPDDFIKHYDKQFTNLNTSDKDEFENYLKNNSLFTKNTLDFYCPKCRQATKIVFEGGFSGYWGEFEYRLIKLLILKQNHD